MTKPRRHSRLASPDGTTEWCQFHLWPENLLVLGIIKNTFQVKRTSDIASRAVAKANKGFYTGSASDSGRGNMTGWLGRPAAAHTHGETDITIMLSRQIKALPLPYTDIVHHLMQRIWAVSKPLQYLNSSLLHLSLYVITPGSSRELPKLFHSRGHSYTQITQFNWPDSFH